MDEIDELDSLVLLYDTYRVMRIYIMIIMWSCDPPLAGKQCAQEQMKHTNQQPLNTYSVGRAATSIQFCPYKINRVMESFGGEAARSYMGLSPVYVNWIIHAGISVRYVWRM